MTNFHKFSGDPKCIPTSQRSFIGHLNDKFFVAKPSYSFDSGFIHSFTETRRKSCLIYKPLNKSLLEEGQKQKLATKDTEEKQRSQRKIWGKKSKNSSQAAKNFTNCSTEEFARKNKISNHLAVQRNLLIA